jgi:hypothetical protein
MHRSTNSSTLAQMNALERVRAVEAMNQALWLGTTTLALVERIQRVFGWKRRKGA